MSFSGTLDMLLRLGEQIAEAVRDDAWSQVSKLVDRRAEIVNRVFGEGEIQEDLTEEEEEKLMALEAQNDQLLTLLREQRDSMENELAEVEQLRDAQDSYTDDTRRDGVLPSKLQG